MRLSIPAFRARTVLILALFMASAWSGCLGETAVPAAGPLTLKEAHTLASPVAAREAADAHLVGFVGHEGPPPSYLGGFLDRLVADVDTSEDDVRADGRAHLWVMLYGTSDGKLLRIVVRDPGAPLQVGWSDAAPRELVKQLWAMNLGGRLVYDSPAAVEALVTEDDAIAAHLDANGRADVVYASSVAPVDGPGTEDLVYEIYFGDEGGTGEDFAFYGQVYHYTGVVVKTGDAVEGRTLRRETLVEETFQLGPYPREVTVERNLPRRVEDAQMALGTDGTGAYEVVLLYEDDTEVGGASGRVVTDPQSHDVALGTLEPGTYRFRVSVTGQVAFDLKIVGSIGL